MHLPGWGRRSGPCCYPACAARKSRWSSSAVRGGRGVPRRIDWGLCLVTDRRLAGARPLEEVVRAAIRGGVTLVELREKECGAREFVALARRLREILAPAGIPLIINDR